MEPAGSRFLAQSVLKHSQCAFWHSFCSLVWIIVVTLPKLVGNSIEEPIPNRPGFLGHRGEEIALKKKI